MRTSVKSVCWETEYFMVKAGIYQGSAQSPYLFCTGNKWAYKWGSGGGTLVFTDNIIMVGGNTHVWNMT